MLRQVSLPDQVPGALYLAAMPGRPPQWLSYEATYKALLDVHVDRIVSLAGIEEIRKKSPDYANAIRCGNLPCERCELSVSDFSVPDEKDRELYVSLALSVTQEIQQGQNVLVHCGAGIGRTGTFAICVLLGLGASLSKAYAVVTEAGSHPETSEQREFVKWCQARIAAARV